MTQPDPTPDEQAAIDRAVDRIIEDTHDEPPTGRHGRPISEERWAGKETVPIAGEWL